MITIVGLGVLGTRVLARLSEYENILAIDFDTVEDKNLRRQYPPAAEGMRKVDAARKYIRHDISIIHKHIDWSTAGLLHDSEFVLDCTDNMLARYVINDYCAKHGIPWVHGALSDIVGTVATILPEGPCYQCIYPKGVGEECTELLSLTIADKTADLMVQELARLRMSPESRFIRVQSKTTDILSVQQRANCPTCTGKYHYLEPHDYYITYCNNAHCMSAKPVHALHHDHGEGQELTVNNIPLTLFQNGEIHFHKHANEDELRLVAEAIYISKFRNTKHKSS